MRLPRSTVKEREHARHDTVGELGATDSLASLRIVSAGRGSKRRLVRELSKNYDMYLMVLPAILVIFVFKYIPIYGIIIAFQDYNPFDGYARSEFVGLENFIDFFEDPFAYRVIRNTIVLGSSLLLWTFWPPILLALSINEVGNTKLKRTVQSISYLPHFISTVIIVGMLFRFISVDGGVVNEAIRFLGFRKINFQVQPQWFRPMYIVTSLWQGVGWGSILYLAAISSINPELYEAAFVEGANRFHRILYVTLPGMAPTIIILLILNIRTIVNIGTEKVLLMYNPAVYETADVIATYIYRKGILGTNQSYAAAIGLFNSIIALILVVVVNRIARRVSETSLW